MAVGLGYWQMMRLIVLPQALKITIPNIVNTFIGMFKDTSLVFIVGIFDLLRTIEVSRIDPKWATPVTSTTGYLVAALFLSRLLLRRVAVRAHDRGAPRKSRQTIAKSWRGGEGPLRGVLD